MFLEYLTHLRIGNCTNDVIQFFENRRQDVDNIPEQVLRLFFTNKEINVYNDKEYEKIKTKAHEFFAQLKIKIKEQFNDKHKFQTPNFVRIKVGVPIIVTRNLPQYNLTNGTLAIVVHVENEQIMLKTQNQLIALEQTTEQLLNFKGEVIAEITGYPIMLAFACSIHRAQGLTLPQCVLNIQRVYQHTVHLLYVAVSRVQRIEDITIVCNKTTFEQFFQNIKVSNVVKDFYSDIDLIDEIDF